MSERIDRGALILQWALLAIAAIALFPPAISFWYEYYQDHKPLDIVVRPTSADIVGLTECCFVFGINYSVINNDVEDAFFDYARIENSHGDDVSAIRPLDHPSRFKISSKSELPLRFEIELSVARSVRKNFLEIVESVAPQHDTVGDDDLKYIVKDEDQVLEIFQKLADPQYDGMPGINGKERIYHITMFHINRVCDSSNDWKKGIVACLNLKLTGVDEAEYVHRNRLVGLSTMVLALTPISESEANSSGWKGWYPPSYEKEIH